MSNTNKTNSSKILKKASIGAFAAAASMAGAGYKLTRDVVYPKTIEYNKHYHDEIEKGNFKEKWFHSLTKEEFYIESSFGYKIHGFYFTQNSNKTIIIIHGITVSLWSSVKYMNMFMERGYNVIIYDHRNHGLSGGEFTSLGAFEKMDGLKIIEYAKEKDGEDIIIGLHGESMGAATAMLMSDISDVDFIVEDCGFSSAYDELAVRLKDEHSLPKFPLMPISEFMTNKMYGFSISKDSPIEMMNKIDIPILFIHGGDDDYVPTEMVNELYNAKEKNKEIHIFQGSKHACSYMDNSDEYMELVHNFMNKYNF